MGVLPHVQKEGAGQYQQAQCALVDGLVDSGERNRVIGMSGGDSATHEICSGSGAQSSYGLASYAPIMRRPLALEALARASSCVAITRLAAVCSRHNSAVARCTMHPGCRWTSGAAVTRETTRALSVRRFPSLRSTDRRPFLQGIALAENHATQDRRIEGGDHRSSCRSWFKNVRISLRRRSGGGERLKTTPSFQSARAARWGGCDPRSSWIRLREPYGGARSTGSSDRQS